MLRHMVLAALLLTGGCATSASPRQTAPVAAAPACEISPEDRAWIDRALEAWRMTSREITHMRRGEDFQAVFFDADCVLVSTDALSSREAGAVTWTASPHAGTITLPNGDQMPAGVTSFTKADSGDAFFVMSTPSVWRASGVDNPQLGLETMMVAVLLHEGSHVSQGTTYGLRVGALAERYHLPESFDDDSMQGRFRDNADFSASIARETDLFFQAAAAPSGDGARRLAREARDMMRSRAARWVVGEDAYWTEAEDLWLSFEGSGQWAGYEWVIHPQGANVAPAIAIPNFAGRSGWWSQNEGLAIFLALDRIAGPGWKRHVYGDGQLTALQLLDEALAER